MEVGLNAKIRVRKVGKLVVQYIDAISKKDSGLKLQELFKWCYA